MVRFFSNSALQSCLVEGQNSFINKVLSITSGNATHNRWKSSGKLLEGIGERWVVDNPSETASKLGRN
jgi:hypothetical protein